MVVGGMMMISPASGGNGKIWRALDLWGGGDTSLSVARVTINNT